MPMVTCMLRLAHRQDLPGLDPAGKHGVVISYQKIHARLPHSVYKEMLT